MADRISNNPANFEEGGIYGGGTNIMQSVKYTLWDYGGTRPPDSQVAVKVICQPTDGSNEGKPHEVFWSVGPSTDFRPDHIGGSLIPVNQRAAQSKNSNWAFVLVEGFMKNCGLDGTMIDGEKGITVLDGTEVTLGRVDPPKREGLQQDAPPQEAGQQGGGRNRGPNKILMPTRAKFPWEKGSKATAKPSVQASGGATAASRATMGQKVEAASANGADGSGLADILAGLLADAGGSLDMAGIAKAVGEQATAKGVSRGDKLAMMKEANSADAISAIAAEKGWTYDAKDNLLVG